MPPPPLWGWDVQEFMAGGGTVVTSLLPPWFCDEEEAEGSTAHSWGGGSSSSSSSVNGSPSSYLVDADHHHSYMGWGQWETEDPPLKRPHLMSWEGDLAGLLSYPQTSSPPGG